MRTCELPGCDGVHKGRGLCGSHLYRLKAQGADFDKSPIQRLQKWPDVCSVENCDTASKVMGLCPLHYNRFLRHGPNFDRSVEKRTPPGTGAKIIADALRLPADAPCFDWPLSKDERGYGFTARNRKTVQAHRLVCELAHGRPAPDQVTRHSCDNPSCINPHHLSWGLQSENVRDRDIRNRTSKGEAHYKAKLKEAQVIEIERRARSGENLSAIAADYNVTHGTVYFISKRLIWKHLFQ